MATSTTEGSLTSFEEETEIQVKLGFLEECDPILLKSHFFPSKVGGKPSWLSLCPLPETKDLECSNCLGVLTFLLQVYAPLKLNEDTFHRSLFVFVCTNPSCVETNDNKCFKVFRSQLPLENDFYSQEPPNEEISEVEDLSSFPSAEKYHSLCNVCGIIGSKKCSKCKKVFYCCRDHQVADWKAGHKAECSKENCTGTSLSQRIVSSVLFKEADLVTEDEIKSHDDGDSNVKEEAECIKEYENLMRLPQLKGLEGKYKTEDLEQSATAETEDDKQFLKFKRRIQSEPTQVLRYARGAEPLWISAFHKSRPEDIPLCHCGAARIFECQIMPQLLSHLKLDRLEASLDWGTVCLYTCVNSCAIGNAYKEEFVWKQDIGGHDS